MEKNALVDILYYLRMILFVIMLALIGIQIVPGWGNQIIFLFSSLLLVAYAFLNLLHEHQLKDDSRITPWRKYAILLFIAMIFGTIGDFAMPGLFLFPTDTSLLNGILYFGIGHVFYLLAMKGLSPLLMNSGEKSGIKMQNLIIWICCVVFVFLAFALTVYNPDDMILSIGALGYGVLLISAVAFAITKWFDEFPLLFKIALIFGFVFFFLSDWVIAIQNFWNSTLFSGTSFVGTTYLIGQLLIHSAVLLGFKKIETT